MSLQEPLVSASVENASRLVVYAFDFVEQEHAVSVRQYVHYLFSCHTVISVSRDYIPTPPSTRSTSPVT